jgi:hypothetical protein
VKIRIVVQQGENPDDLWTRHVRAYVAANMCPRCGNALDAYGRCHPSHGQWELTPDGWRWGA